ncbi:phosphatase [Pseudozyma hubeiensis SY62]|uniref:Phosphatase n=1 Tax=Pseudozyma hubeiensis (strain SY62) TaxID=1305764 RepID=R9NZ60_PSEHS|nr:phosphatase [Pseudozyma hubeiensis SY62]GAC94133.1 phosphatase [Pseudozyma hubeiensis SY62]
MSTVVLQAADVVRQRHVHASCGHAEKQGPQRRSSGHLMTALLTSDDQSQNYSRHHLAEIRSARPLCFTTTPNLLRFGFACLPTTYSLLVAAEATTPELVSLFRPFHTSISFD